MTGPREWRHAELCAVVGGYEYGCNCGLSAVRDATAVTVPVPLTAWNNPHLERLLLRNGSGPARGEYDDLLIERDALREALRIAVEGLAELGWFTKAGHSRRFCAYCGWDDAKHRAACPTAAARAALAAVRELVDLGGDDE